MATARKVCLIVLAVLLPALISAGVKPRIRPLSGDCPFVAEEHGRASRKFQAEVFDRSFRAAQSGGAAPEAVPAAALPRRNFIDEHILGRIEANRIPVSGLASDAEFLRRASLDLTGRIPSAQAVRDFMADSDPRKRDKLVDALLSSSAFVDRWTLWFADFFRNTIYPVAPEGRNALHQFVYSFVGENRPYDNVVVDLLSSSGDSFGVGPVNYLMKSGYAGLLATLDTYDEIAVQTSRNFLGVRILCISCHQGTGYLNRINLWLTRKRREDFWGQAAFFTQMNIDVRPLADMMNYRYRVEDSGPGVYDPSQYIYDESFRPPRVAPVPIPPRYILNGAAPAAGENLRRALGRMIVADPQFSRATVNYLWAQLMVTGIVDPPDGFDLARQDPQNPPSGEDSISRYWRDTAPVQPSHPELLDALGREFATRGYDIRRILRLICTSTTYQLSSAVPAGWKPEHARFYSRRQPRLLSAEEVHDAMQMASGVRVSYAIFGTQQRAEWAFQLRGPEEPANIFDEDGYAAINILESFGRGDRFLIERTVNRMSLFQPLNLMHSFFVFKRVNAATSPLLQRVLAGNRSRAEIVEELYLATLSRLPTSSERAAALGRPASEDRTEAAEDLLWVLFNKLDFIFNY